MLRRIEAGTDARADGQSAPNGTKRKCRCAAAAQLRAGGEEARRCSALAAARAPKRSHAQTRLYGSAEARERWPFITLFDASTIKTEAQLVSLVKDRTGKPRPDAERDVQSWTCDRQF